MRKLVLLFLLTSLAFSSLALAGGDPAAGKIKAYTCTGCHGIPGYKNTYPMYKVPKIAGQNAAYLVAALSAYRAGDRPHPTMKLQAESLSQADIDDITAWLSSIEARHPDAPSAAPGSGQDKTLTCQACHGTDGMGTDPVYPVLAGQHGSYIARALNDYKNGTRKNTIMSGFAGNLSDQDIEDLAKWYSGLSGLQDLSGR